MRITARSWARLGLLTLSLWGCESSSTDATNGASTATTATAAAGSNAASAAGAGAMLPAADKCPQLPAVQGFTFTSCCQADSTCGVDASSLNRGCMSYAAFKKFFNFAPPPATTCDGVPIAGAAGAGAAP